MYVQAWLCDLQVQGTWPVFITFWAWSLSEVIRCSPSHAWNTICCPDVLQAASHNRNGVV